MNSRPKARRRSCADTLPSRTAAAYAHPFDHLVDPLPAEPPPTLSGERVGICESIGAIGSAYDNASAERLLSRSSASSCTGTISDWRPARTAIFELIEVLQNPTAI